MYSLPSNEIVSVKRCWVLYLLFNIKTDCSLEGSRESGIATSFGFFSMLPHVMRIF